MANKIRTFEVSDEWLQNFANLLLLRAVRRPEGLADEAWQRKSHDLRSRAACYLELLDRRRAMASLAVSVTVDTTELARRCEEMKRYIAAVMVVPQGAIDAPELSGSAGQS